MGSKVEVRLLAAADAPILKQKKYLVDGDKQVQWIASFLRKYLQLDDNEPLFIYVSQAFSPSPLSSVQDLANCFGTDEGRKLVLHYARTQAWG